RLQLVEAGAHDGQLARDILSWLSERRAELFKRIEYWIVEPSERRQKWQKQTLGDFAAKVRWFSHAETQSVSGIIFCNELLDSLPVHRLGWDAPMRHWFEWGVAVDGENFVWARLTDNPANTILAPRVSAELLDVLPDGFKTEICPAADS